MAEPMTDERRGDIAEREQAATEGPWWFDESDLCWRLHGVMGRIPAQLDGEIPEQIINKQILKAAKRGTTQAEYWPDEADAAFIVHARQDVPDLLAEVGRLRAELELAFSPVMYFDIQQVLDKALGTAKSDGAGAGIVEDIGLLVSQRDAALVAAEQLRTQLKAAQERADEDRQAAMEERR